MNEFQYRAYLRKPAYIAFCIILICAVVTLFFNQGTPREVTVFGCILYLALAVYTLLLGNYYSAYAVFDERGIHVRTGKHVEIAVIPWKSICHCMFWKKAWHTPSYGLFLKSPTAQMAGSLLMTTQDSPRKNVVQKYLADGLMARLAQGRISASEFEQQTFYCFVLSQAQYNQARAFGRAAVEEQPVSVPQP